MATATEIEAAAEALCRFYTKEFPRWLNEFMEPARLALESAELVRAQETPPDPFLQTGRNNSAMASIPDATRE